jgi:hypothetical protein
MRAGMVADFAGRNFDEILLGNRPVTAADICGKPASLAYKLACRFMRGSERFQENQRLTRKLWVLSRAPDKNN